MKSFFTTTTRNAFLLLLGGGPRAVVLAQQNGGDLLESRYLVTVMAGKDGSAQFDFPDPITITCDENVESVALLDEENLDFKPADCQALNSYTLQCSNPVIRGEFSVPSLRQSYTSFVVACRSFQEQDLIRISVTLPASSYSSANSFSGTVANRWIDVDPICDAVEAEGSLPSSFFVPYKREAFNRTCTEDTSFQSSDLLSIAACYYVNGCLGDSLTQPGLTCDPNPLPEVTLSIDNDFSNVLQTCIFRSDPAPFPVLDTPMQAHYEITASYREVGGCPVDIGNVRLTCGANGIISFANPEDEGGLCERVDTSTLNCDLSSLPPSALVMGEIICGGDGVVSSLEQLSLTATWNPDGSSLGCPSSFSQASIIRTLTLNQQCSIGGIVSPDFTLQAQLAVSCYPFVSDFTDSTLFVTYDPDTEIVVDTNTLPAEYCSLTELECFWGCDSTQSLSTLIATIRPEHIKTTCLAPSGAASNDDVDTDTNGGNTGDGDTEGNDESNNGGNTEAENDDQPSLSHEIRIGYYLRLALIVGIPFLF